MIPAPNPRASFLLSFRPSTLSPLMTNSLSPLSSPHASLPPAVYTGDRAAFDVSEMSAVVWNGQDRVDRLKRTARLVAQDPVSWVFGGRRRGKIQALPARARHSPHRCSTMLRLPVPDTFPPPPHPTPSPTSPSPHTPLLVARACVHGARGSGLGAQVFSRTDGSHLTRPQAMKLSLQKAAHMIKRVKELQLNEEERYLFKQMVDDINFSDLHSYMFIPAIEGQGTDEQGREWLPKARAFEWIGCYAQTELGHGSNVQGLETTASYVPETDEWDVHTPTITATKWWPGGLGKASNHAVVYARLISKGKDHGVHAFLVPIRSLSDHKPLPGVTVGDIGPKFGNMGYNTMDNGFLAFSHVRIPRTNMLMRYAGVDRSGEYHRGSAAARQLAYGAMVFVRRSIVMESGIALGRAVTIAARYSCVRRQFGSSEGGAESKVMDYQTQQMRLLPLIASAYAFLFAGKWMAELYNDVVARIKRGDYSTLPEVHAATAGLKALTTAATAEGIEECRKLCGGHGYSLYSALPQLYAAFVPTCTYEGDNTVLLLQVARYLLKAVSQASEGKRPWGTAAYLGDANNLTAKCTADNASDFLQTSTQLAALQACAFHKAVAAATAVAAAPSLEKGFLDNSVALTSASTAHCCLISAAKFVERVQELRDAGRTSQGVLDALQLLCDLYCLHLVDASAGDLVAGEYFSPDHPALVRQQLLALLPQFSDHFLNSSLGRFNGDVYTDLVSRATADPMNIPDVIDGYEEFLRPFITRQTARL
ncbi:unnamed protein product [Closterium sp. Naga37s-1]|nr:unnamed protein product [Closterium sp. Naga37s-1]